MPLRYGSRVVGVIVVSKLGLDQFDEDDVRLLEVLAGHAAVAVENASLYESARREAESATSLLEFGRELATLVELDDIAARVTELSAEILGSRNTSFYLETDGELRLHAEHGHSPETAAELASWSLPLEALFTRDRDPYIAEPQRVRAGDRTDSAGAGRPVRGCAVRRRRSRRLPRRARRAGGLRGARARAARRPRAAGEARDRQRLELRGARADVRLDRRGARQRARGERRVHVRPRALDHDLSLRVGRELGLDERALKCLELGALLHDIGKIGIPSDVLSKPGRLTAAERTLVQTHPELGERIIAPIDRLQTVRPIVRHCHERWDGRGYPDGVAGEDIPLESRIIFVCDAYHAMTTDRPYRRRLSHREAVRRLAEGAGSQFDPHVVEVALRVLEHPSARASRRSRAPSRRPRACGRDGGTARRP